MRRDHAFFNKNQMQVINHLTGEIEEENRNLLVEIVNIQFFKVIYR